ncbi:MAG: dihydropteroate synthase, partial [Elusimicrobiota bacterium]
MTPAPASLRAPARSLPGSPRPRVMGILNVTADSFYEDSRVPSVEAAVRRGLEMEAEGADILDIGGESTRPGSDSVSQEEECRRVLPVVEALAKKVKIPLSIDTSKAAVAERAFDHGASILNDVTALRGDPRMSEAALRYPVVLLMHMLGTPRTMQEDPRYSDAVAEVAAFLRERLSAFSARGGDTGKVWLDPGIGFGKTLEHNLEILSRLEELRVLGRPLVLGASRKSFIGGILGEPGRPLPARERLPGSLAAACRAAEAGVHAVRVHDVKETREALDV